jgi:exonuclease III
VLPPLALIELPILKKESSRSGDLLGVSMRLISWNLNGRVGRLGNQIKALVPYQPDVIAFQEVLMSTVPRLRQELSEAALAHSLDWDLAERNVLAGLTDFDLSDVFRCLNGYEVKQFSWYWRAEGGALDANSIISSHHNV